MLGEWNTIGKYDDLNSANLEYEESVVDHDPLAIDIRIREVTEVVVVRSREIRTHTFTRKHTKITV
jgi:trimethylamine:corrinoid methyltransferase-like protein